MSSYGHIRDLAKKEMSIDIDNNYEPEYLIADDKIKLVNDLKRAAKKADTVWLASDEDREGEAIAWHLQETLDLKPEKTHRIVFNEITKNAILNAIEHPRDINMNLVDAQQARRVLDRLVGYEISPILWSKIKPALSAGRVQSVAVRLIVERENEIRNFKTQSFFKVTATFHDNNNHKLLAELSRRFDTAEESLAFLNEISESSFSVTKMEKKPARRSPAPPFTTSTLQQEASRKLGFSVARTMQIAQQLYESGLITYMRTDSTNLSEIALSMAKEQISDTYGTRYVKTRRYHTKIKGAQEAHEAIRPTDLHKLEIDGDTAARKLYELIWKRTIASQMADAELEKTTIDIAISNSKETFCCTNEQVIFDGFLKVYLESTDEDDENTLSLQNNSTKTKHDEINLKAGSQLKLSVASAAQHYTQHPARYTEASLVKKLEDLGIGRPSTYAPTISTILKREYVSKEDRPAQEMPVTVFTLTPGKGITEENKVELQGAEKGKLFPTDIGSIVNQFLMEHFNEIMDYNFTAKVEKDFDDVANGSQQWRDVIGQFYVPFHKNVRQTQVRSKRTSGERLIGVDPASGKNVYAKIGRFGTLIQIGETSGDEKPRFASMKKGQSIESITLQEALELFNLPRSLGLLDDSEMVVNIGRFGPYVRHNGKFYSLSKNDDPYTITAERAQALIKIKQEQEKEKEIMRSHFPHDIGEYEGEMVVSNNGKYGPYLTYKNENYRLPKNADPLTISLANAVSIIREMQEKKKKKKK